jgi:hypothetical protein
VEGALLNHLSLTALAAALLLAAAGAPAAAADAAPSPLQQKVDRLAGKADARLIYRGVTVIDGSGAAPQADMAIVVDGERIAAIVPAATLDLKTWPGYQLRDMQGLYALPGLIDTHVHYATQPDRPYAEAELKRDIYAGITGVRDMAGDARALADLSRAALIHEIPAPDIFYAALVAGPSFFADPRTQVAALGVRAGQVSWLQAIDDGTDLRLALARARGTGATGLKIYANLPGPLVRGLIAEAQRQHFPVWTHAQVYPASPYDSLGATAVSHVCMIARYVREPGKASYGHSNEPSYDGLDARDPGIAAYIAALAKSGTIMDATLSVYQRSGPHCQIGLAAGIARAMHQAGVPLSAGTDTDAAPDAAFPALHNELELLAREAGLAPADVIVAATRNAAAVLGQQAEFGTLAPGKLANLVFVRDDPIKDIANLRSVVLTVKRGHPYARADYHPQPMPPHEE